MSCITEPELRLIHIIDNVFTLNVERLEELKDILFPMKDKFVLRQLLSSLNLRKRELLYLTFLQPPVKVQLLKIRMVRM